RALEDRARTERAPGRRAQEPARPGPRRARVHAGGAAARGHLRACRADRRRPRPGPERPSDRGRTLLPGSPAMSFSFAKIGIIARREYLTTVRRKAFVVAIIVTPAIFFVAGVVSTKMQVADQVARQSETRIVALVDSSGLFANAPLVYESQPPSFPTLPE